MVYLHGSRNIYEWKQFNASLKQISFPCACERESERVGREREGGGEGEGRGERED